MLKAADIYATECGKPQAERPEYFTAIREEMANGGYAALMDMLLNRDLSKFDAEDIPESLVVTPRPGNPCPFDARIGGTLQMPRAVPCVGPASCWRKASTRQPS